MEAVSTEQRTRKDSSEHTARAWWGFTGPHAHSADEAAGEADMPGPSQPGWTHVCPLLRLGSPPRLPQAKPSIYVLDHWQEPQGSSPTPDTSSPSDYGPRPRTWYQALARCQENERDHSPPPVLPLSSFENLGLPLSCIVAKGRKRRPDQSSLRGLGGKHVNVL